MSSVVICLLKMRAVMSFAGAQVQEHLTFLFLFLHTRHCDKHVNETLAGYTPHALQWNSAACSCSLQHGRPASLGKVRTLLVIFIVSQSPCRQHLHRHQSSAYARRVLREHSCLTRYSCDNAYFNDEIVLVTL